MEDKMMEKLNNNINLNTEDVVMTAGGKESFNSNNNSINSNINTEDVANKDQRKESLNTTTETTNNNFTKEDKTTRDGRKESLNTTTKTSNNNITEEDVMTKDGRKESLNTTTSTRNNNITKEDVTTKDGRKESLNTTTNTTNNNITMEDVATKDGRKDSFLVIEEHIETKQMTTPSQDKNYSDLEEDVSSLLVTCGTLIIRTQGSDSEGLNDMQSGSKADEEVGNNAKLHMIKNKRKEKIQLGRFQKKRENKENMENSNKSKEHQSTPFPHESKFAFGSLPQFTLMEKEDTTSNEKIESDINLPEFAKYSANAFENIKETELGNNDVQSLFPDFSESVLKFQDAIENFTQAVFNDAFDTIDSDSPNVTELKEQADKKIIQKNIIPERCIELKGANTVDMGNSQLEIIEEPIREEQAFLMEEKGIQETIVQETCTEMKSSKTVDIGYSQLEMIEEPMLEEEKKMIQETIIPETCLELKGTNTVDMGNSQLEIKEEQILEEQACLVEEKGIKETIVQKTCTEMKSRKTVDIANNQLEMIEEPILAEEEEKKITQETFIPETCLELKGKNTVDMGNNSQLEIKEGQILEEQAFLVEEKGIQETIIPETFIELKSSKTVDIDSNQLKIILEPNLKENVVLIEEGSIQAAKVSIFERIELKNEKEKKEESKIVMENNGQQLGKDNFEVKIISQVNDDGDLTEQEKSQESEAKEKQNSANSVFRLEPVEEPDNEECAYTVEENVVKEAKVNNFYPVEPEMLKIHNNDVKDVPQIDEDGVEENLFTVEKIQDLAINPKYENLTEKDKSPATKVEDIKDNTVQEDIDTKVANTKEKDVPILIQFKPTDLDHEELRENSTTCDSQLTLNPASLDKNFEPEEISDVIKFVASPDEKMQNVTNSVTTSKHSTFPREENKQSRIPEIYIQEDDCGEVKTANPAGDWINIPIINTHSIIHSNPFQQISIQELSDSETDDNVHSPIISEAGDQKLGKQNSLPLKSHIEFEDVTETKEQNDIVKSENSESVLEPKNSNNSPAVHLAFSRNIEQRLEEVEKLPLECNEQQVHITETNNELSSAKHIDVDPLEYHQTITETHLHPTPPTSKDTGSNSTVHLPFLRTIEDTKDQIENLEPYETVTEKNVNIFKTEAALITPHSTVKDILEYDLTISDDWKPELEESDVIKHESGKVEKMEPGISDEQIKLQSKGHIAEGEIHPKETQTSSEYTVESVITKSFVTDDLVISKEKLDDKNEMTKKQSTLEASKCEEKLFVIEEHSQKSEQIMLAESNNIPRESMHATENAFENKKRSSIDNKNEARRSNMPSALTENANNPFEISKAESNSAKIRKSIEEQKENICSSDSNTDSFSANVEQEPENRLSWLSTFGLVLTGAAMAAFYLAPTYQQCSGGGGGVDDQEQHGACALDGYVALSKLNQLL